MRGFARARGREGGVTEAQYGALLGPGGACDPTTRERRVAHEAAAGRRSKEIAVDLGVAPRAVDAHRTEIARISCRQAPSQPDCRWPGGETTFC